MKGYVLFFALLLTIPAQGAQFAGLVPGETYRVSLDGFEIGNQTATDGTLAVELPAGMHLLALVPSGQNLDPDPDSDPDPNADPSGLELFVAGYDDLAGSNRFEVLDRTGKSLTGTVRVLQDVSREADLAAADLNGDGTLEVVAAGYHETMGVVVEYWNGQGQKLHRIDGVFSTGFDAENWLLTGNLDGQPGNETILLGRDPEGAYQVKAYDFSGTGVADYQALETGFSGIESLFAADVDGDGAEEVVVFAKKTDGVIALSVLGMNSVKSSALVFGSDYTGATTAFALDVNGDGTSEIAALRKSGRSQSFRMLVLSGDGTILMKKNLLRGKFEDNAAFAAADLDGDGYDEITALGRLAETGENVIQVLDHDGKQILASAVLNPSCNGCTSNLFADVDGDGDKEIVVGGKDSLSGTVVYQVLDAEGALLSQGKAFETGSACDPALRSADLDEDGTDDLLVLCRNIEGRVGLEVREPLADALQASASLSLVPHWFETGNMI